MNIVYRYLYPILGLIVAGLILVLGFIVIRDMTQDDETAETPKAEDMEQVEPVDEVDFRAYTVEEVSEGNTRENCLLIYEDEVYFIPNSYFSEHPGGANAIINNCGNDVTEAFNGIHNPNGSAFTDLEEFKVGEVTESISTDSEGIVATFTEAEVSAANTIDDCLMSYDGNVYRIPSSWADEHPGGSFNIIDSCGKDITGAFQRAHTGNETAFAQIQEFFVGTLEN